MGGSAASQKYRDGPDHRTVALMTLYDEYLQTLEYGVCVDVAVAQATGVIMQRHDLSVAEASEYLCGDAVSLGLQPAELARLILDSQLTRRRVVQGAASGRGCC